MALSVSFPITGDCKAMTTGGTVNKRKVFEQKKSEKMKQRQRQRKWMWNIVVEILFT